MAKSIVVQFFPDGTVAHTRDKDFDISEALGAKRSIQRMTDILFDDEHQKFYIVMLKGVWDDGFHIIGFERHLVTNNMVRKFGIEPQPIMGDDDLYGICRFDTYEDAVAFEIKLINAMRLHGVKF